MSTPRGGLGATSGALSSSSSPDCKAASWNRQTRCTMARIALDPPVAQFVSAASLSTSRKRAMAPSPPPRRRGTRRGPLSSSAPATPVSTASVVGFISPHWAAHCLASLFTSSADWRSSWIFCTRKAALRGRRCLSRPDHVYVARCLEQERVPWDEDGQVSYGRSASTMSACLPYPLLLRRWASLPALGRLPVVCLIFFVEIHA